MSTKLNTKSTIKVNGEKFYAIQPANCADQEARKNAKQIVEVNSFYNALGYPTVFVNKYDFAIPKHDRKVRKNLQALWKEEQKNLPVSKRSSLYKGK